MHNTVYTAVYIPLTIDDDRMDCVYVQDEDQTVYLCVLENETQTQTAKMEL